ncbi:MAG TPA: extracellular solute-binding protein [Clostridia bacterium]
MVKKVIIFIICVILVFPIGLLNGCKDNGKIKINLGMWPSQELTNDIKMYQTWKELFEKEYPQYEIVVDTYKYNPDTFLPLVMSQTQPTVFETWFTEPQKLIDLKTAVKDITEPLKQLGWYDKMDPEMRESLSRDGKIYGVPRDGYGLGLYINKRIFADVGIFYDWNDDGEIDIYDEEGKPLYPTTFEELTQAAITVTQATNNSTKGLLILSANRNGGWQFSNIAWNFGASLQIQNNQDKWIANLNSPEAIAALQWIKDLKWEHNVLLEGTSYTYSDWYEKIGTGAVAMCFAGSDALSTPITMFDMDKEDVVFVPMPEGPGGQYTLFGGTPFMFSYYASDEQVLGALRFLEYMGRSPEVSEIALGSLELGASTAIKNNMIVVDSIKPWINEDYRTAAKEIEQRHCNVNIDYFKDFFNNVNSTKRSEEPYYCQEMYAELDTCLQEVLRRQTADPSALLATANSNFQSQYMSKLA